MQVRHNLRATKQKSTVAKTQKELIIKHRWKNDALQTSKLHFNVRQNQVNGALETSVQLYAKNKVRSMYLFLSLAKNRLSMTTTAQKSKEKYNYFLYLAGRANKQYNTIFSNKI